MSSTALALTMGLMLSAASPAAAQQITKGGGDGGGFVDGVVSGSGGLGGGGGGREVSGAGGGDAALTPGGVASNGNGGGGSGSVGAAGSPNGVGAGGGGGATGPNFGGDGGGDDRANIGATGDDGFGGGGGGGGGAGNVVATGDFTVAVPTISGGAGGFGKGGGGGGVGLVSLGGGTIAGAAGTTIIGGSGGALSDFGGGGGAGVFLYSGGELQSGSTIIGGAGGSGRLAGAGGAGVLANQAVISNAGAVTGGSGGNGAGSGLGGGFGGAGGSGMEVWQSTVTNLAGGTITGGAGGDGAFAGTGNGAGGAGGAGVLVRTGGGSRVENYGVIAGGNGGADDGNGGPAGAGGAGVIGSDLTVVNGGTILGGLSGDAGSPQANAIIFTGTNATVINNTGAHITGGQYGIIANTGSVNVTNSGSITGTAVAAISAGADATVINNANAIIMGDTYGIFANSGSANVTNSGSIIAPNGNAISAWRAMVINNAGASITGRGVGIFALSSGSSIFNAGTISGPHAAIQFLDGGSSVFNSGTISSVNLTAIRFANTGNTLTLAPGSVITGDVLGGGSDTFQLGGTGAATFDVSALGAQYQGFGTFNKIGSSVWTLTGTSSFTGDVNVNAGTLVVNGDLSSAGPLLVNPGGTLSGTGTVPFTLLDAGATLAPGPLNGTGTLTIMDRVVFCDCATYAVKVSATGSDRVNVVAGGLGSGEADLIGLVRVTSPTGTYRFNSPYTILSAQGGLNGSTFDTLATPTGIGGALSYTSNDVLLTLTSQLSQIAGLNGNQQRVANALDAGFNAGGNVGGLSGIFNGNVPQNLSQVSGELGTGAQQTTFQAMNLFMGLITDPFSAGRGVPNNGPTAFADDSESMAYAGRARSKTPSDAFAAFTKAPPAVFAQRWNVWAAGYGGSQTTDGNAVVGSNNTRSSVYGGVAGADYWFSPDTVAGFALAGGGTNFSVANGGSGRSDMFQAGAFVRHNFDATYVTASVAYGWQDVTTDRYVSVTGVDHLRANFNANAYSGRLELGHRFLTPWFGGLGVSPYAAAQVTAFELPSYTERAVTGNSTFALAYNAKTSTATRSELGIRTDKSYALDDAVLTLRGRAAWAHDFNPNSNVTATFQTLPGASFVVNGAALAPDATLTTASAEVSWLNGWSVAATFEGEFSDVTRSYAGKGVVRYNW